MSTTEQLVSIVILNWNGDPYVYRCIDSVSFQTHAPIEIIVVDNGSTDGSIEKLESKYPGFVYVKNKTNLGYAVGMNQGIRVAKGSFIVPLNQDVYLDQNFVAECINRISHSDDIGAIGGRVFSWESTKLTDSLRSGEGERTFLRKRFQGLGGIRANREIEVFRPNGSFPFLRRAMLDDVYLITGDYFDENYVTGWEDTDLFLRMQLRGWRCLFVPTAYGWHVGSGSVGGRATLLSKPFDYQVRVLRNRYFTMAKDLPLDIIFWLLPHLCITEMVLVPYFLVRSPRTLVALFIAQSHVIRNSRILLAKRRRIQKSVLVPSGYLRRFFVNNL